MELLVAYFFVNSIYVIINLYLPVVFYNFGYGFEYVGLFQAIFEAAGIVGPIFLGALADKKGWYKQLCIICLITGAVAFYILSMNLSFIIIFICLIIFGLSFRSVSPIFDSLGTLSLKGREESYSFYRSFGTLGFMVISALLAIFHRPFIDDNINISFYYALITVFSVLSVVFISTKNIDIKGRKNKLESTNTEVQQVEITTEDGKWYTPALVLGLILLSFSRFSMTAVFSFLSLYSIEVVKYNNITMLNVVGTFFEFFVILASGRLLSKDKITPYTLIMIGTFAVSIRFFIYVLFPTIPGILVAQALHCFCFGAYHIGAVLFISKNVRKDHRAMGLSLYYAIGTGLPAVIGSSLSGIIVANKGYNTLFISYAIVCLVAVVFGFVFKKTLTAPSPFDEKRLSKERI
jgi:PPP family 3-phenylpropionic acid transporter